MPGRGYSTLGLKPDVLSRLTHVTDVFYPGMFFPSTLIILMNEVKMKRYTVEMHRIKMDMTGRYNTLTIRSDVKEWLDSSYEKYGEEYEQEYRIKCFSHFITYFLSNLFESKFNSQGNVIKLQESDFKWLQDEYRIYRNKDRNNRKNPASFDRFADAYVNEILCKMRMAKEILST